MSNTIVDAFEFESRGPAAALTASNETLALSCNPISATRAGLDCAEMSALAQNLTSALIHASIAKDLEQQISIVSWTA